MSEPHNRPKYCTEHLRHTFSDGELREIASQLARGNQRKAALELEKKQVMDDFKAQDAEQVAAINRNSTLYNNGFEFRMIKCAIDYHVPSKGYKRISREDTGEVIREEKMTAGELQDVLFPEPEAERLPDYRELRAAETPETAAVETSKTQFPAETVEAEEIPGEVRKRKDKK